MSLTGCSTQAKALDYSAHSNPYPPWTMTNALIHTSLKNKHYHLKAQYTKTILHGRPKRTWPKWEDREQIIVDGFITAIFQSTYHNRHVYVITQPSGKTSLFTVYGQNSRCGGKLPDPIIFFCNFVLRLPSCNFTVSGRNVFLKIVFHCTHNKAKYNFSGLIEQLSWLNLLQFLTVALTLISFWKWHHAVHVP